MSTDRGRWLKAGVLILTGIAIGWAMPGTQPSSAKEAKNVDPPRIGYVNIAKVLKDFKLANEVGKSITKRRLEYVEQVKANRAALETITEQYRSTEDEQARTALQNQAINIQKRIEEIDAEAQKTLTEMSNTTIVKVNDQVRAVIAEMAKDRGLDVVEAFPSVSKPEDWNSPQVAQLMLQTPALVPFYLKPEYDFTEEVIERLNKKYPPEQEEKPAK